jgi:hypothetical protein
MVLGISPMWLIANRHVAHVGYASFDALGETDTAFQVR